MNARPESRITIGPEKVSVSIVRKTHGDLLVSNYAIERYFRSHDDARNAIKAMLDALALPAVNDGEPG